MKQFKFLQTRDFRFERYTDNVDYFFYVKKYDSCADEWLDYKVDYVYLDKINNRGVTFFCFVFGKRQTVFIPHSAIEIWK